MIKIHFSFWLAAGLFIALGMGEAFALLFLAVTLHELSHVLVAKIFGCQLKQFRISALGEVAVVPQMERLRLWKRALVIAAGPACNLVLWGISQWISPGNNFGFYNLVLACFNLLPVLPLDGARLFQLWAGDFLGVMRANRLLIHTGRVFSVVLMVLGTVQAALFFPNFSFLFMGYFLWRRNKSIWLELTGEFYMAMLDKPAWISENSPVPAKILYAYPETPIAHILDQMGWEKVVLVAIRDKPILLDEEKIVKHVIQYGMNGGIGSV